MANLTGNSYVDALISGYQLTNNTLLYYLDNQGSSAWSFSEAAAFDAAANTWEAVANVTLARTFNFQTAHLSEYKFTDDPLFQGIHDQYVGSLPNGIEPIFIDARFDFLSGGYNQNGIGWDAAGLVQGGEGFSTIVHELGHALGLDHPHADGADPRVFPGIVDPYVDAGTAGLNSQLNTIMSYRNDPRMKPITELPNGDGYGRAGTPMAFDIAAIQAIYGANMSHATGNDIYTVGSSNSSGTYFSAIWDAGGNDTIRHTGSQNVRIDLRAATLSSDPEGGGYLSQADGIYGGFVIAKGVVIENATGSTGTDVLTGNEFANRLDGGGNTDSMFGGGGDDVFVVDNIGDAVIEVAGEGTDTIESSVTLTIADHVEVLRLTGTADLNATGSDSRDFLYGNSGENILNGGGGIDVMAGGAGNDTYAVDDSSDAVLEDAGGGYDNVYSSVDYIIDGAQEIESAILTGNATVLRGDNSDNQLFGNAQVNVIDGRGGTDYMLGLGGADIFQIGLEAGAQDIVGDFSKAEGDRMAFTGFNATTTFVNQASATSFEVRDTKGTLTLADDTVQTFILNDSYGSGMWSQGSLEFNVDYYFG